MDDPQQLNISLRTCERVLLICTPEYARKANEGEGGVGYERSIVTAELARRIDTNKFICVVRQGTFENAIPTFAQGRRHVDFRQDSEYDVKLDELLRTIHRVPKTPEPQIGPKPSFKSEAAISNGINSESIDTGSVSPESVVERAIAVLSKKDMMAWKRLVRKTRQDFQEDLVRWRSELERKAISNDESWRLTFDSGVRLAEPLISLSICATESEIESIRDQAGIVDAILSIERWSLGGAVVVIEMPRAIGFVAHELLGTYYMTTRSRKEAISLLMMQVRDLQGRETKALITDHEMMGYVRSLSGNCVVTWKYLADFFSSRTWMKQFFSTRREFISSYRAYNFLASVIELALFLKKGGTIEQIKKGLWLDVPAMFLHPVDNDGLDFDQIVNQALLPGTVTSVCQRIGCLIAQLQEVWPIWYQGLVRSFAACTDVFAAHRFGRNELPTLPP